MVALANVSIGARCEDRIGGTPALLARRSEDTYISGIGNELRIRDSCHVPLYLARARRRTVFHSPYVICRGVGEAGVVLGLVGRFLDVLGVHDVEDVAFRLCARHDGFFFYVLAIFVGCRIYGDSVYSFNDGLRYGHLAGAADNAYRGHDLSYWWSRGF